MGKNALFSNLGARQVPQRMVGRSTLFKMAAVFLLTGALSSQAVPQGGCYTRHTFNLSGSSGGEKEGPGGGITWQQSLAAEQATYGGIGPTCTYTWLGDITPGEGWYGECYSIAYVCPNPPAPPPSGVAESSPGPHCNASSPVATCGQPINLATGNTYIQQTDLVLPGLGGGLNFTRTWNSLWPPSQSLLSAGLFGNNWRSTYEERIFDGSDGTIKYARADGSFWSFLPLGSPATYQVISPSNVTVGLTQQGTSTWTVTFQSGDRRVFNYTSGSLTSIIDRNGNTTQISYDGINRLATVTDPAGRHLYFGYGNSSSTLVTSLTTDFGTSLSYAYDGQSRLSTVTKPDLTTISFQYDTGSHIITVLDSNGKVLESHTYDSNGRGLTSSQANGVGAVTVSY